MAGFLSRGRTQGLRQVLSSQTYIAAVLGMAAYAGACVSFQSWTGREYELSVANDERATGASQTSARLRRPKLSLITHEAPESDQR
jgi:hypothetical protein